MVAQVHVPRGDQVAAITFEPGFLERQQFVLASDLAVRLDLIEVYDVAPAVRPTRSQSAAAEPPLSFTLAGPVHWASRFESTCRRVSAREAACRQPAEHGQRQCGRLQARVAVGARQA